MEKIDFINNQQPALNATNLNKLQDNTEDAIQEVQDVVDDLDTNKLDKTSVKDAYSTSETDTYSCNYVNINFDRKGNMLKIFEGSTASASSNVINTTWQELGKFNLMIVELYKSNTNSRSTIIIPYFMLSTGSYLNESFRTTNVYENTWLDGDTKIHIIPSANTIGNNYIKFDSYDSNIVISAIYIIY